jgi:hypothetical protein
LLILEETEPEDDRTYLENITRDAFGKDRGLSKGSNKAFTWAVINSFLGLQNTNLHLDEKIVKTFMEDYTVNKFNYFIFFIKCILLYIINIIFYHPH